jgi:glutamate--cysteine ligase catalytic subunit
LVDTDCRWSVIEASVDDRTREERGLEPLIVSKYRIEKSRYASVSRFVSAHPSNLPEYNDLNTAINDDVYHELVSAGIDHQLASHVGHLFIRDPLVVFSELLQQDNSSSSDHFENIQSTNWQTVRFKPPSLTNADLGWRVEFRPMEVQLSDFENAAFTIFSVLLARSILHFRLSLYLPLSLVELNLKHAQKRSAVLEEKFFFRTNVSVPTESCQVGLLSASELICGKPDIFEGLSSIVRRYLTDMSVESGIRSQLERYISFVEKRATGEAPTPAKVVRDFVLLHPQYANDSVVTEKITYDLVLTLSQYK